MDPLGTEMHQRYVNNRLGFTGYVHGSNKNATLPTHPTIDMGGIPFP